MVCEWLRKRDATMAVAGFLQAGAKMPALNGKFSEGLSVNFEGWGGTFENDWCVADFCEDAAAPNRADLVVACDGCGVITRSQTGGLSPHPSYGWRLRAGEERTRAPRAGLPVLLSAHDPEGASQKKAGRLWPWSGRMPELRWSGRMRELRYSPCASQNLRSSRSCFLSGLARTSWARGWMSSRSRRSSLAR